MNNTLFLEKDNQIKIMMTGLLLQREYKSFSKVFLKKQDADWVRDSSTLWYYLFYKNYLHLVKLGNEELTKSVKKLYSK